MKEKESSTGAFEKAVQESPPKNYILTLYVTGTTPASARAVANIKRICEEYLQDHYQLEVIDLYQQPDLAKGEQIFTIKGADHSFRVVIENMSEGTLTMTGTGDILYANQRFADMLRRPLKKVIGSSLINWIKPADRENFLKALHKEDGKRRLVGLDLVDSGGALIPSQLSLTNLQVGDIKDNIVVVVTDLTERIMVEEAINSERLTRMKIQETERSRKALLRLIKEQKRTGEALRKSEERYRILSEQLQEADLRKDEFLGALSHEIRNPLASITMGLSLLDRTGLDTEKAKQAREIMSRQVSQLSHLVDDLLDVTRIARNLIVLKKKQVELNTLAYSVVADYMSVFQEKGVSLTVEPDLTNLYVDADPVRLTQVLGNLLHNSLKFTQSGGATRIILSCNNEKQLAVIKVKDYGIGMTSKTIKSLFQPFMQVDSSLDRSNGGLGLGLALAKGLMELHGGHIEAYSNGLGKGSMFTLYLPLSSDPTNLKAKKPELIRAVHRQRILLIEDIKDVAEILRALLEEEGNEVMVAGDGRKGVEMAKEYRPDVVLCDIGLPGMDGYEVARVLRSDETLEHTFLISLTGYARPEDLQRSKEAGFHFQLTKPVALEELRETLGKAK